MGPSGSGKSTLLNALALRLDPGMAVAGDVRLNGRPYGSLELKRASGYVMQVRGCARGVRGGGVMSAAWQPGRQQQGSRGLADGCPCPSLWVLGTRSPWRHC